MNTIMDCIQSMIEYNHGLSQSWIATLNTIHDTPTCSPADDGSRVGFSIHQASCRTASESTLRTLVAAVPQLGVRIRGLRPAAAAGTRRARNGLSSGCPATGSALPAASSESAAAAASVRRCVAPPRGSGPAWRRRQRTVPNPRSSRSARTRPAGPATSGPAIRPRGSSRAGRLLLEARAGWASRGAGPPGDQQRGPSRPRMGPGPETRASRRAFKFGQGPERERARA